MSYQEKGLPSRERQIEVMTGAAERSRLAMSRLLARREIKELLHRHDAEVRPKEAGTS